MNGNYNDLIDLGMLALLLGVSTEELAPLHGAWSAKHALPDNALDYALGGPWPELESTPAAPPAKSLAA